MFLKREEKVEKEEKEEADEPQKKMWEENAFLENVSPTGIG